MVRMRLLPQSDFALPALNRKLYLRHLTRCPLHKPLSWQRGRHKPQWQRHQGEPNYRIPLEGKGRDSCGSRAAHKPKAQDAHSGLVQAVYYKGRRKKGAAHSGQGVRSGGTKRKETDHSGFGNGNASGAGGCRSACETERGQACRSARPLGLLYGRNRQ